MRKRTAQSITLAAHRFCRATSFASPDEYDDSQSNPFRTLAYSLHPVGWLAEWPIFRPFHYLVSGTGQQEAFSATVPIRRCSLRQCPGLFVRQESPGAASHPPTGARARAAS